MEKKLKCKKCGFEGDFTAIKTDRFCSKCGTPFFTPLDAVNKNITWTEVFNSYYNLNTLIPTNVQYAINRVTNWRFGITVYARMLRTQPSNETKLTDLDRSITFHRSFVRTGYALRMMEEKISQKNINWETVDINSLENDGKKNFGDMNVFDSVWDTHTPEENDENKAFAQKILSIANGVMVDDIKKYFLIDEMEQYLLGTVSDSSEWSKTEGIKNVSDENILSDIMYGYSLCISEKLLKK